MAKFDQKDQKIYNIHTANITSMHFFFFYWRIGEVQHPVMTLSKNYKVIKNKNKKQIKNETCTDERFTIRSIICIYKIDMVNFYFIPTFN